MTQNEKKQPGNTKDTENKKEDAKQQLKQNVLKKYLKLVYHQEIADLAAREWEKEIEKEEKENKKCH